MILKDIIEFIDDNIPPSLALKSDDVGFKGKYDLSQEISSIKIYMDLLPEDDDAMDNTLIITHHPPLFVPTTPTYTVHSNWDIIDGGANDELAKTLCLEVKDCLDTNTNIGRICKSNMTFDELKNKILDNFSDVRIVNVPDADMTIKKIGIISGFGLRNPNYIKLSKEKQLDVLISGDLTHETAILSKNLGITLIDLNHHDSEIPGLYALANIIEKLNIKTEVIDKTPIEKL